MKVVFFAKMTSFIRPRKVSLFPYRRPVFAVFAFLLSTTPACRCQPGDVPDAKLAAKDGNDVKLAQEPKGPVQTSYSIIGDQGYFLTVPAGSGASSPSPTSVRRRVTRGERGYVFGKIGDPGSSPIHDVRGQRVEGAAENRVSEHSAYAAPRGFVPSDFGSSAYYLPNQESRAKLAVPSSPKQGEGNGLIDFETQRLLAGEAPAQNGYDDQAEPLISVPVYAAFYDDHLSSDVDRSNTDGSQEQLSLASAAPFASPTHQSSISRLPTPYANVYGPETPRSQGSHEQQSWMPSHPPSVSPLPSKASTLYNDDYYFPQHPSPVGISSVLDHSSNDEYAHSSVSYAPQQSSGYTLTGGLDVKNQNSVESLDQTPDKPSEYTYSRSNLYVHQQNKPGAYAGGAEDITSNDLYGQKEEEQEVRYVYRYATIAVPIFSPYPAKHLTVGQPLVHIRNEGDSAPSPGLVLESPAVVTSLPGAPDLYSSISSGEKTKHSIANSNKFNYKPNKPSIKEGKLVKNLTPIHTVPQKSYRGHRQSSGPPAKQRPLVLLPSWTPGRSRAPAPNNFANFVVPPSYPQFLPSRPTSLNNGFRNTKPVSFTLGDAVAAPPQLLVGNKYRGSVDEKFGNGAKNNHVAVGKGSGSNKRDGKPQDGTTLVLGYYGKSPRNSGTRDSKSRNKQDSHYYYTRTFYKREVPGIKIARKPAGNGNNEEKRPAASDEKSARKEDTKTISKS